MSLRYLVFLIFLGYSLSAQWVQEPLPRLYPPKATDHVKHFIKIGNHYYANVQNSGIYRRSLTDTSWTKLDPRDFYRYHLQDSMLYFINIGRVHSLNINQALNGATSLGIVTATDLDADPNFIYLSDPFCGMQKVNRLTGASSIHKNGLPSFFTYPMGIPVEHWGAYSILKDGSNFYLGTFAGLYKSNLNLGNWTRTGANIAGTVRILEKVDSTLYCGSGFNLYRSTDGQTWNQIHSGSSNVDDFAGAGNQLAVLGEDDRIHYSQDQGASWTVLNLPMGTWKATNITFIDDSLVIGSEDAGVFFYHQNIWSWEGISPGFTRNTLEEELLGLKALDDTLISYSHRGIFKLAGNRHWEPVSSNGNLEELHLKGDTLFQSYRGFGGVYRVAYTSDKGITWTNLQTPILPAPHFDLSSKYLYFHSTLSCERAFRKTNPQSAWEGLSSWRYNCGNFEQLVDFKDTTYFLSFNGLPEPQVVESSQIQHVYNYGLPWNNLNKLFPLDSTLYVYANSAGLYKTSGLFQGWSYASNGLIANDVFELLSYQNSLIAATDQGIYASPNQGGVWTSISGNLGALEIQDLCIVKDTLYALDENLQVWKTSLLNVNLELAEKQQTLAEPELYPNPARGTCTILLDQGEHLKELELRNLNGQVVLKGSTKEIDLSRLMAGLYLIQVKTNIGEYQLKLLVEP